MGRRIRKIDVERDLEQLLKHCLDLAEISGLPWTAIRISTALDQYQQERRNFAGTADRPAGHTVL